MKTFAFERYGLRYYKNAPFSRPTASGPVDSDAPVCKNCANYCPVGENGLQPDADGKLPRRYESILDSWRLDDLAKGVIPEIDYGTDFRREDLIAFLAGIGLCVALPPTAVSGFGAPPTHETWWCGHLSR
jgi:hypothetical protein